MQSGLCEFVRVLHVRVMQDSLEERVHHDEQKNKHLQEGCAGVRWGLWLRVCQGGGKWGSLNEGILLLPGYRRELFRHSRLQPPLPHEKPAPVNEHVLFLSSSTPISPYTCTRAVGNSRTQTIEAALFLVVANTESHSALLLWRREDSRHGKPVLVQQISQWTKGRSCVMVF